MSFATKRTIKEIAAVTAVFAGLAAAAGIWLLIVS